MKEQFKKYPNDLFEAKKISSETRSLEVDHNIKAVYLYMLLRYEFFKQSGGVFFENQDEIGDKCGLSRRSIIRYVQKLKDIGLVAIGKKRLGNGALSNNYIVHRVDGYKWWYDDNRQKQQMQVKKSVVLFNPDIEDEYPF